MLSISSQGPLHSEHECLLPTLWLRWSSGSTNFEKKVKDSKPNAFAFQGKECTWFQPCEEKFGKVIMAEAF